MHDQDSIHGPSRPLRLVFGLQPFHLRVDGGILDLLGGLRAELEVPNGIHRVIHRHDNSVCLLCVFVVYSSSVPVVLEAACE